MSGLPVEVTSFVGRAKELVDIKGHLAAHRMVTLVGPAGVGKTRLAIQAARQVIDDFDDGVRIVRLEDVQEPGLLSQTVAGVMGLSDSRGDATASIVGFLARRSILLVLDNCEHLADACAAFAEAILAETESVRILATSRHVLDTQGEHLITVRPLETRSGDGGGDAVTLFAHRAQAVTGSGFDCVRDRELATMICVAVDGIPLAIELTAAWLRVLTLEEIFDKLQHRFVLLSRGSRSGPSRHQTLRAAIDWSYQLCTPSEALLWARLSVFTGGFTLKAVESVCFDHDDCEQALSMLSGLVDKSIVIHTVDKGVTRYRMLETIREYGMIRLAQAGEDIHHRRRHAEYFRALIKGMASAWLGPNQLAIVALTRQEHANLRAALDFSLAEPGNPLLAAQLAVDLEYFWVNCGLFGQGVLWLDRVLALPDLPEALRVNAMWVRIYAATALGDATNAATMAEEAVALARAVGDPLALGNALLAQGGSALAQTQYGRAEEIYRECLDAYDRAGHVSCNVILAHTAMGMAAAFARRPDVAETNALRAIAIASEYGEQFVRSYALYALALAEWDLGKLADAEGHAHESLEIKNKFGDVLGQALTVELCAWIASAAGDDKMAATLLGVLNQMWLRAGGVPMLNSPTWQAPHDQCERSTQAALGGEAFRAACAEGARHAPDLQSAVRFVLNAGFSREKPSSAEGPFLTKREREIADLIAEGRGNKSIAVALDISRRTVEAHVQHILEKLGFESRTQIGVWVVGRQAKA